MHAQFELPPGDYRAVLTTCTTFCTTIQALPFKNNGQTSPVLTFKGNLLPADTQRLELSLLPASSSLALRPLGLKQWIVKMNRSQP